MACIMSAVTDTSGDRAPDGDIAERGHLCLKQIHEVDVVEPPPAAPSEVLQVAREVACVGACGGRGCVGVSMWCWLGHCL